MFEKIGLPSKPAMRGGNWVLDASHCQGCSTQFTLLNRKHHCQRCGGLFCNSCTQQRMILHGQGDSPVRICDPCKKIEEAARFELRHGHRNKATKVTSKATPQEEDDVLSEILGADGMQHQFSNKELLDDVLSEFSRTDSTASSSSSFGANSVALSNTGSIFTPEELRQQAAEEKEKYKLLKAEGKSDEALRVFKHSKELERQAAALEIELRRSRRLASKAPHLRTVVHNEKIDDSEEPGSTKSTNATKVKKDKNDLTSDLRELGWSDADIHNTTKPASLTVEGELAQLLGEVAPKSSQGRQTGGVDKSQVNALKRQALVLKREGRLAEAKEELKRAKILEKQLEEQEILGESEESDDELAAIIHGMTNDDQDVLKMDIQMPAALDLEQILRDSDDLLNDNFQVSAADMNDPGMTAALRSFGWTEEDDREADSDELPSLLDSDALQEQVRTLKREAVIQKRAGNVTEAMSLLRKARLLEKELETMESDAEVLPLDAGQVQMQAEDVEINLLAATRPKSKMVIQKELIALKKKAIALRREGKHAEAEGELEKGKVLEKQLEELDNTSKKPVAKESKKNFESTPAIMEEPPILDIMDEKIEAEVTEHDMQDPALLSVLKDMGWDDADTDSVSRGSNPSPIAAKKPTRSKGAIRKELLAIKKKALALTREGKHAEAEEELEKGKILEKQLADMETTNNSKAAQVEADGMEYPTLSSRVQQIDTGLQQTSSRNKLQEEVSTPLHATDLDTNLTNPSARIQLESNISQRHSKRSKESSEEIYSVLSQSVESSNLTAVRGTKFSPDDLYKHEPELPFKGPENTGVGDVLHPLIPNVQTTEDKVPTAVPSSMNMAASEENLARKDDALKEEIRQHKINAVTLKREGKLAEAREALKQAKLLERQLADDEQTNVVEPNTLASTSIVRENEPVQPAIAINVDASASASIQQEKLKQPRKPIASRDRLKIQREALTHKRNAMKLRREGKTEEADAELEMAKELETQLEDLDSQGSKPKSEEADDAILGDLFDPQIMAALKSIGLEGDSFKQSPPEAKPARNPAIQGLSNSPKQEAKSMIKPAIQGPSNSAKAVAKPTIKPTIQGPGNSQSERTRLTEQIKAEKLRAVNLKREGKQAEALEALRSAKRLEKHLDSLS